MSRKNNPKETVEKIITVSAKLFIKNGYEKTSMQEIVEALGMSKGAIFHHFKSKEAILNMIMKRQAEHVEQTIGKWLEELQGLTAKEKLMGILEKNIQDQQIHSFKGMLSSQITNPHFIVASMQGGVNKSAPIFAGIIREGKADGSITTEFPEECSEAFFLLINIWCDPIIFHCDKQSLKRRLSFLQQMMAQMGMDIISDDLILKYLDLTDKLYGGQNGLYL